MRPETEDLLAGVETHHPPFLTDVSSTKIRNARAEDVRHSFTGRGAGRAHSSLWLAKAQTPVDRRLDCFSTRPPGMMSACFMVCRLSHVGLRFEEKVWSTAVGKGLPVALRMRTRAAATNRPHFVSFHMKAGGAMVLVECCICRYRTPYTQ